MQSNNLPVLLAVVALALAALVAILLLFVRRRREPEAHVQQASNGSVIYHRHDARVSVTVVVERSD